MENRKTTIYGGMALIALHLLAILCERGNRGSVYGTVLGILLSFIRSSIYITLFTGWGFSIAYRIIAVHTRKYLMIEAAFMVLWMLIRSVKYVLTVDVNIDRYLWYLYYIPMLLIPLFAIFSSLSLGRYDKFTLPKWTVPFAGLIGLLILLILTNDVHQWIFRFPEDAAVFSGDHYQYAPGYYLILVCEGIMILLAFGIMLYRCRLPKRRKIMWLPVIPILGMILYGFLYITNYKVLKTAAPDLTVSFCCLIIAAYECCIGNGMIQTNTHYRELFENAEFPIYIVDKNSEMYMKSKKGEILLKEENSSGDVNSFCSNDKMRFRSLGITGGKVIWAENIAGITEEIKELQDLREALKESHSIVMEEYRTNKEKVRLEEVNRIYDNMQLQTAECLEKIRMLLKELGEETQEEKERYLLGKIAVYGAYFKRRNNLLFVDETQKRIRAAEMEYCLKESFAALEYLNIAASYEVDVQGDFLLYDIIRMYDLFEKVIEECMEDLRTLTTIVRRIGNDTTMYISLSAAKEISSFPKEFEVIQEEESEYVLIYQL